MLTCAYARHFCSNFGKHISALLVPLTLNIAVVVIYSFIMPKFALMFFDVVEQMFVGTGTGSRTVSRMYRMCVDDVSVCFQMDYNHANSVSPIADVAYNAWNMRKWGGHHL